MLLVESKDEKLLSKAKSNLTSKDVKFENANQLFFPNSKCEFDSDVLHIHVANIH